LIIVTSSQGQTWTPIGGQATAPKHTLRTAHTLGGQLRPDLTARAVAVIVKTYCTRAGLDPAQFSGPPAPGRVPD
jgi:hypothetical protein